DYLNHTAPTPTGWGYAVFGKVVEGTDVVDSIKAVPTGARGFHPDVPRDDVVIMKAEVLYRDETPAHSAPADPRHTVGGIRRPPAGRHTTNAGRLHGLPGRGGRTRRRAHSAGRPVRRLGR